MTALQVPATTLRDELVAMVREFARRELASRAEEFDDLDRAADAIAAVWPRLAGLGLDRVLLAPELGGAELGLDDFLGTLEELAAVDAGVALVVALHNAAIVALPAAVAADMPNGARWTVAFAPDVAGPAAVEISHDAGSAHLTGRLGAVFGAVGADGVVVTTRAPQPAVIAIPAAAAGLTLSPYPLQMGLRAAPAADLLFDRVPVSPAAAADTIESRTRALVRLAVAAICRGISRRAYEIALAYAHTRIQGGVRLIEHGAIGDMLARMVVRLQADGRPGAAAEQPVAALARKLAASDAAMATTIDAVQVLGGIGYMVDTGVEKLMRDAKYCQLYPEPDWLARQELVS